MSNTVITNYTDLNGPSTKADSSVVVIVNKDGSLSVDQNLLGTLMGTDGSQAAGISVVRVGHEGRPDDATDSEGEDDKVPHVTLSVDSYYNEPNSIIKYDSGAEMLQSLRIETRANSLIGFQNDHCYTPLTSPSQSLPQRSDSFAGYDEPVIEITHTPPPKPIPSSKKITILEQQIIPKGKKIAIKPQEGIIFKGSDVLTKPLPVLTKSKFATEPNKGQESLQQNEDDEESSSASSSADAISDRDSDSDYKDTKDRSGPQKIKKTKVKPRILKNTQVAKTKIDPRVASRLKSNRSTIRREVKGKLASKNVSERKHLTLDNMALKESVMPTSEATAVSVSGTELSKVVTKPVIKPIKKEKKTPAHVSVLLSDMTSLFSTPDVIRRVSTDGKTPLKIEKDQVVPKKITDTPRLQESDENLLEGTKVVATMDKAKNLIPQKTYTKLKDKAVNAADKVSKGYDLIPQIDDASLAQIFQDTPGITTKGQPNIATTHTMNSPSLAGPLSPTLDLLGGLPSEEEGLSEDFLMHVAQLVESSENLQEVLDKQVLGKVDAVPANSVATTSVTQAPTPQTPASRSLLYQQTPTKSAKTIVPQKTPIEIVRRDGRVITLPPIEAPATRSSKRKSQVESSSNPEVALTPAPVPVAIAPLPAAIPDLQVPQTSKQIVNKKTLAKKPEPLIQAPVADKIFQESQESWNSEDDPYRLWCICKQPHNNRFMICCDSCEDWFHGKCVNITKAMGQQMEEQGIEWRCPNCVRKTKVTPKAITNKMTIQKKQEVESDPTSPPPVAHPVVKTSSKTNCIVCKKLARASSIYCSDACILKHAQDSLGSTPEKPGSEKSDHQEKLKSDGRVIVYERKSGRILAGPNAPTAENLKVWLQKNPTFEVVRPGTLSAIKPNITKKKVPVKEQTTKIQTTLNFERIPRKPGIHSASKGQPEVRESTKMIISMKEEIKPQPSPKTPITPKSQPTPFPETPKASTSGIKILNEPRKLVRSTTSRSQSTQEKLNKAPSVSPAASRRKDTPDNKPKMKSAEPIRDNVRKALQEQMTIRMSENTGPKFTEDEIQQFAYDTELELHELFRDVGMKYKAKYRSLMFNIKDRKNLSLWQKICDKTLTPKQLVRLSPEELASQELAQWRDKEAKHQLELIKKSELDLLAASKTYVLKTHKGEEVMETKESVSTELDPNVPVEDLVTALNDSTASEELSKNESSETLETPSKFESKKHGSNRKSTRDSSSRSKKSSRESRRDFENRKSRSSRRKSELKDKDERYTRRSEKKAKQKTKTEISKEKTDSERSRRRSRSRGKSKKRSRSREHSRSISQGRERSHSRGRSRASKSKEASKRKNRSSSKHRSSVDEKVKHRSRSQEAVYSKSKNESTDSDSLERPKSAMLKEAHPEYDPHEPMITSAFSEEDLRKSREDVFEDANYKNEMGGFTTSEYDPAKAFDTTNLPVPETTFASPKQSSDRREKLSEAESDQEPSSTVDNAAATVWNGCINMVDVARFYVAAHEVSGTAADIEEDLSTELDIVGRINPDTVWDYINKMKRASNKDIIILKLQAANDEEKMQYIALYSYLSSRNRLGVVKVLNTTTVKDFYIVPVPANSTLPPVLLPLDGPGLGEVKTHLLIAIVIRQRKKRHAPALDAVPAKMSRASRKRSYTPPAPGGARSLTPPASPRRRALPLPAYTSPALSSSVKDKIAATLASADDEEAYSPGSASSGGSADAALSRKMEELNRQIEEQKQQIRKMTQADSSVADDEAYSPSRPMTPPAPVLADIALPSNLQEILATIKQREGAAPGDVDMRLPAP